MTVKELPPTEYLRKRLRYEAETGKLFWLAYSGMPPNWLGRFAGKEAFTGRITSGYHTGKIDGRTFFAHRIAWALHYGAAPTGEIDHINGLKTDNRILNLRDATRGENQRNTFMRRCNTSGFTGVTRHKCTRRWAAQIQVDKKALHLGLFDTKEAAAKARASAELAHGFSARHGKRKKSP
jgi:hypothetical protein